VTRGPDLARIVRACAGDGREILALLNAAVEQHAATTSQSINLVASHNHMSPIAMAMLSSAVADEIMSGRLGAREHAGGDWIDAIDTIVVELSKRLFGAAAVEYRAMSGATANGLALMGAVGPGATVLAFPARFGGHRTYREGGYGGLLGLRIHDVPCNEAGDVDLPQFADALERIRPAWVLLGTAELLFPYPLAQMRAIAEPVGARIFYDGAHILGLVAGGQFQDPLREGATVLTGSGQKTLGGPISGLVLTTDTHVGESIIARTSGVISNYQNNRIAALAVALAEMVEFGGAYARQVVRNAQALALALSRRGVPVLEETRGFTRSHILLVDPTSLHDGQSAFDRLGEARILTTRVPLAASYPRRLGLRLGTPALTRVGMGDQEMLAIADLIGRVLVDGEPAKDVASGASDLVSSFHTVRFCFDETAT
jgi:glycine hydroxymethyltransferase